MVANERYSSPAKSFTCTLPSNNKALEITDGFDSNGEFVKFQIPYGAIWRVEHFKINGHPVTRLDTSKSDVEQLRQFKENTMALYAAGPRMEPLSEKVVSLPNRTAYLAIMRYASPPPDKGYEERAFLFFKTNTHLTVMQYVHWNIHELPRIENEVTSFYKQCAF